MAALIIAGVVLLLILLLLVVPMDVGAEYSYNQKAHTVKLKFRVLNIPFSVYIPGKKKQQKKAVQEKKETSPKEFIDFVKKLYGVYGEMKEELSERFSVLKKNVTCQEWGLSIYYGTKNPALTGMLNGGMWSAGGFLAAMLDNLLVPKTRNLTITPNFQTPCFSVSGVIVFRFTLIPMIVFVLQSVKLYKTIQTKLKTEN